MLDKMQCEFLLANDNINKINQFLTEQVKFLNIRLCHPVSEDHEGKIVLLVSDTSRRDDYDQLRH